MPTDEKIAFAWSDTPFAIHIPWQAEPEAYYACDYIGGEKTRRWHSKDYHLRVFLRGFSGSIEGRAFADSLNVLSSGRYRADGRNFRAGDRDVDYVGKYKYETGDTRFPRLLNLDGQPGQEAPFIRISAEEIQSPTAVFFYIVVDPRYRDESINGDDATRSLVFRSLESGIRHWQQFGPKAEGRLVVKLDAIEGDPALPTDSPTADSIRNPRPRQVLSGESAVTIRQNAWVIGEIKAQNLGDWSQKLDDLADNKNDWRLQDLGHRVSGSTISAAYKLVGRTESRPGQLCSSEVSFQLDLPPVLWDQQSSGEARCVVRHSNGGSRDLPSMLTPHGLSRTSGSFAWSPVILAVYPHDPQGFKPPGQPALWYELYSNGSRSEGANDMTTITQPLWVHPMREEGVRLSAQPYLDRTLPSTWTADQRLEAPQRLLACEIRFCTERAYSQGSDQPPPADLPRKHFDVFATRLSERENNLAGETGTATARPETEQADDYYEWLAEFNTDIFPNAEAQIGGIRSQLTALAAIEDACVQKFQTLMLLDLQAYKPLSEDKDLLDHLWDQLRLRRDTSLDPTVTAAAIAALRGAREELRVQKAAIPALKQQLIDEGLKIMKQVVETVDVKGIRFNESHPEHKETLQYVKDRYELLRLELCDAAKQYEGDGFGKIMNELGFGPGSEDEVRQLLRAKAALHRAKGFERRMAIAAMSPNGLAPNGEAETQARVARAEALDAALAVLRINPENQEAKFIRQALQVTFLEAIAAKLENEKRLSLMAFQKFFEERGFMTEDPGGWWTGLFESLYVWTGMGPVSSILGWAKMREATEATEIQMEAAAKNHVSLLAIRKLVRNGMPLSEVRTVTPEQMAAGMALATARGPLLPAERIRRLCQDIHETFAELGDLRALAEGRKEEFLQLHPKAYYDLIKPEKSRVEFWSDFFFSPLSLVGWFGPGAIAKVNGSWQYFKLSTTGRQLALLEDIGEVQRSGRWFYQAMKLESVGRKLSKLPGAPLLGKILAEDAAYLKGMDTGYKWLNAGVQAANSGARLMGTLALYGGLFAAADSTNIPALKLLCEVIAQLGVGDMAHHFLSHAGMPVEKALQKLDEFAGFMARKRREIAEHGELIAELEKIQQKLARAKKENKPGLDADTLKQIENLLAAYEKSAAAKPGTIKVAPGTAVETDAAKTIRVAADALKKGNAAQAEDALKGARKMVEAMTAEAEAVVKKLEEAREILKKFGEPKPFVHEASRFKPVMEDLRPELFTLGKNLNPDHPVAAFVLRGDEAVRMGDLEAAETIYKAAKKMSEGTPFEQVVNDRLDLMLCARDYARNLEKKRLKPWASNINEPMRESEEQLASRLNGLSREMKPMKGGANAIYRVLDKGTGKTLVFKAVPAGQEDMVLREVMGSALFNAMGGKAPTARRVRKVSVPEFNERGDFVKYTEVDGIVYHFAEGKEVGDLTEPEILALRDELAPLRAFRLWLCDTDGHMRNFMMSPNGHVIPIDFGYAHLRKAMDHPQLQGFSRARSQKEFMEEAMRFNDMLGKADKEIERLTRGMSDEMKKRYPRVSDEQKALYGWVDRVDGMLSYDDMSAMVEKIQQVCQNKSELRRMLESAFAPDAAPPELIEEAVETLVARGEVLKDVLEQRFTRYKQAAKKAATHPIAVISWPRPHWPAQRAIPAAA